MTNKSGSIELMTLNYRNFVSSGKHGADIQYFSFVTNLCTFVFTFGIRNYSKQVQKRGQEILILRKKKNSVTSSFFFWFSKLLHLLNKNVLSNPKFRIISTSFIYISRPRKVLSIHLISPYFFYILKVLYIHLQSANPTHTPIINFIT